MHALGSYLPLFIMTALAVTVPFLLKRIKSFSVPIIVGEIIAGMIVGKTGFGILGSEPSIEFLSDIGFAILMFLSGMEVDIDSLVGDRTGAHKNWHEKPLLVAWAIFAGTLIVNALLCFLLAAIGLESDKVMVILLLSTTSLGIVVPTLKERNILDSGFGQNLLLSALIADVMTMLLMTVYFSWRSTGQPLRTVVIAVIFVAALAFYFFGKKFMQHKNIPGLLTGTSQIMIRFSFFVLLGFVLLAELLGVEIILGAFIAGLIVSLLTKDGNYHVREKMDTIGYGFFIPAFFINAGAQFDLSAIFGDSRSLYAVPIVLIMAFASKVLPSLLLIKHESLRDCLSSGFLLSAKMSLIVAASAIALKMHLITDLMSGTLLVVAILTCTLSPVIFDKIRKVKKT